MKTLASLALVGLVLTVVPAAARAPVCIRSADLDRTSVVDPQKILFRLKDGTTYSSHLKSPCLGLKFNGFVYVTPTDEICGGFQSIRVLQTNEVCVLGAFEPEKIGQHHG